MPPKYLQAHKVNKTNIIHGASCFIDKNITLFTDVYNVITLIINQILNYIFRKSYSFYWLSFFGSIDFMYFKQKIHVSTEKTV